MTVRGRIGGEPTRHPSRRNNRLPLCFSPFAISAKARRSESRSPVGRSCALDRWPPDPHYLPIVSKNAFKILLTPFFLHPLESPPPPPGWWSGVAPLMGLKRESGLWRNKIIIHWIRGHLSIPSGGARRFPTDVTGGPSIRAPEGRGCPCRPSSISRLPSPTLSLSR